MENSSSTHDLRSGHYISLEEVARTLVTCEAGLIDDPSCYNAAIDKSAIANLLAC